VGIIVWGSDETFFFLSKCLGSLIRSAHRPSQPNSGLYWYRKLQRTPTIPDSQSLFVQKKTLGSKPAKGDRRPLDLTSLGLDAGWASLEDTIRVVWVPIHSTTVESAGREKQNKRKKGGKKERGGGRGGGRKEKKRRWKECHFLNIQLVAFRDITRASERRISVVLGSEGLSLTEAPAA